VCRILSLAVGPSFVACGGDGTGCSDFEPTTDAIAVGRSVNVTVRVVNRVGFARCCRGLLGQ
jgi:hypothetical protein